MVQLPHHASLLLQTVYAGKVMGTVTLRYTILRYTSLSHGAIFQADIQLNYCVCLHELFPTCECT
jgi:hypothetical protein